MGSLLREATMERDEFVPSLGLTPTCSNRGPRSRNTPKTSPTACRLRAVANAVYHARGVRVRDLPIRLEKLLEAPTIAL